MVKRIPILFIDNGNDEYLNLCLLQTMHYNQNCIIYVLTSRDKSRFVQTKNCQYIFLQDYCIGARKFTKLYRHMSPKTAPYELFRLQRWFVISEFMAFFQIPVLFYCEDTVLIYQDISCLYLDKWSDKTVLCYNDNTVNTCVGYWRYQDVCHFCDLIVEEYQNNLDTLQCVFAHLAQLDRFSGENDCILLWKFLHQSNFIESLTDNVDGVVFDFDISSADNRSHNEFQMEGRVKKIEWRNHQPFAMMVSQNTQVQLASLCFSDVVRDLLPAYYKLNFGDTQGQVDYTRDSLLLDYFRKNKSARHWWFHMAAQNTTLPPLYSILDVAEQQTMKEWFEATNQIYAQLKELVPDEPGIPVLSFLQGLIMGNNISKIVECGASFGYASLLLGFMQKKMQNRNSVFSIELIPSKAEFARTWTHRAGLGEHIRVYTGGSTDSATVKSALAYLAGTIELVFIDTSKTYSCTIAELETWYPLIKLGGFIIMNVANYCSQQMAAQSTPQSVREIFRALSDWHESTRVPIMMLNNNLWSLPTMSNVNAHDNKDFAGLCIIQKQS